jgi:hypothetical protein
MNTVPTRHPISYRFTNAQFIHPFIQGHLFQARVATSGLAGKEEKGYWDAIMGLPDLPKARETTLENSCYSGDKKMRVTGQSQRLEMRDSKLFQCLSF